MIRVWASYSSRAKRAKGLCAHITRDLYAEGYRVRDSRIYNSICTTDESSGKSDQFGIRIVEKIVAVTAVTIMLRQ